MPAGVGGDADDAGDDIEYVGILQKLNQRVL